MNYGMRVFLGLTGGAGVAVMVCFLFSMFGMSALINPSLPPMEKCQIYLERVFVEWPMPVVMSVAIGLLNGFLWLFLTAGWPNRRHFRRLLLSSAIAAVIIALVLPPILFVLLQPG